MEMCVKRLDLIIEYQASLEYAIRVLVKVESDGDKV